MKRRDAYNVILDILEACDKPTFLTYIMLASRVNYRDVKKYLNRLEHHGYVNSHREGRKLVYTITEKGRDFLKRCEPVIEAIEAIKRGELNE